MTDKLSGSTERERERVERRGGCSEAVAAATFFLGDDRADFDGDEVWEDCNAFDAAALVNALAVSKNGEALRRRAPRIG